MSKYLVNTKEKCIHCQTIVQFIPPDHGDTMNRFDAENETLFFNQAQCPSCGKLIVSIDKKKGNLAGGYETISEHVVWPQSSGRPPAPSEVPENIASDYNESSLVLPFSAKASAALSRRCLQTVLVDAGKATPSNNLSQQIDEVLPNLPTYIAENVDAIRNVGNFATLEQKSKASGEILDVEPGEAEWNLDVLDALFDDYYVRPEIEMRKREELNIKLTEAGKPLLK